MPERTKFTGEIHLFNLIFVAMGMLLLGVATWIAASAAHLPAIEQRLDDFILAAQNRIDDHENRIRTLELRK